MKSNISAQIKEHLWNKGHLGWKLWDQQIPIYNTIRALGNDVTTIVILCARQFGKSYLGALMAVEDCLRNPDVTVLIVGPTIKQTTDIVHQGMRKIQFDAPKGLIKRTKSESRWKIGSSELILGGFDIQNATRQRGKTLYKIYMEELVDSSPDDYDDTLKSDLGPALTHSKCGQIVYLTTPPKIPDHPFLTDTVPEAKQSDSFFCYTIDDNKMLSQAQYDACVKRSGGKDSVEFQREYMCRVVRDKSILVVPNFNKDNHVGEFTYPQHGYFQITTDWGGVRDKTCSILHVYDYILDKDLIFDERKHDANTDTATILRGIREMIDFHNKPIYADYADVSGQLQVDLKELHNYEIIVPPKDDWKAACNNLDVGFAEDRIWIHPRCTFLIENCNSGTFNKKRTDFERTRALGHCDGLAALMYGYRVQNRENPWPANPNHVSSDMYFIAKSKEDNDMEAFAKSIQPRVFSTKIGRTGKW